MDKKKRPAQARIARSMVQSDVSRRLRLSSVKGVLWRSCMGGRVGCRWRRWQVGRVEDGAKVDGSNGGVVYPVKRRWHEWRVELEERTDGMVHGVGTRSCEPYGVRWWQEAVQRTFGGSLIDQGVV
jgi:hypothetical protein